MIRKSICILSFFFGVLAAYSQENHAYIKAGVNLANISTTSDGRINKANELTSFQIGILGDIALGKLVAIQPGLLFTGKGAKTQSGQPSDASYFRATSNPYYIEAPVYLTFKFPFDGRGGHFFAGAGPYVAMGITGKNKSEGKVLGAAFKSEKSINWSNDDPSTFNYEEGSGLGIMRRFDYGLNGTVGLVRSNGMLSLNYGYGLAKLQSGSNSSVDDKNKHRVISVSLGIRL